MSCHKAIVVITGRAHFFHDCIYNNKTTLKVATYLEAFRLRVWYHAFLFQPDYYVIIQHNLANPVTFVFLLDIKN